MKVAVIGSGISGLTAAYLLRDTHDVVILERDARPGGHANTQCVPSPAGELGIDTGFIVYNETTYPGFSTLLGELHVLTQPGDMSFACRCLRCGSAWSSLGLRGLFATRRNLARPSHLRLLPDLLAFYRDARRMLAEPPGGASARLTLGDYAQRLGRRRAVVAHYLIPMAAAVWSTPPSEVLAFPLRHMLEFLENHGLIGWGRNLQWRTVSGGSRAYVQALLDALPAGTFRASVPAVRVRRGPESVAISTPTGEIEADHVVFACHADEALALLADPSPEEREALGAIPYTANRVVLHTDEAQLPARAAARASWNVTVEDCRAPAPQLTMTYLMNRLQALPGDTAYCVSVNPAPSLDRTRVIASLQYTHPRYTFESLAAQARVEALQGVRNSYFAGAYLGYGFHEDGYQSGRRVARLLGAPA